MVFLPKTVRNSTGWSNLSFAEGTGQINFLIARVDVIGDRGPRKPPTGFAVTD